MKTIKNFSLSGLILLMSSLMPVVAQVTVSPGSNHDYTTDILPGVTYQWSTDAGIDLSAITGNVANITWGTTPGNYTLTVYPVLNGCSGDPINLTVTIIGTNIQWNANAQNECPASGVYTPTPATLNASFSGLPGTWSFTYSVDGGAAVSATDADPTYTLLATDYINNTGSDITHTVRILSVTPSDGTTIDYSSESEADATAANRLFTLTVSPKPGTLNTILQN